MAYRILVPAAGLIRDPELEHLITEPWATTWAGPEGHFVGYPLRGGELYNMIICVSVKSTLHGKSLGEDDWLVTADNAELMKRFEGWCSPVQKLCALAGQVSIFIVPFSDLRSQFSLSKALPYVDHLSSFSTPEVCTSHITNKPRSPSSNGKCATSNP